MNHKDEIATRLHGSQYFSTLDANKGYFHVKLTENSSYLTTFNCIWKIQVSPDAYGCQISRQVPSSHGECFGSIEGVEVGVDDLLIHGTTLKEHNKRLQKVLEKWREINLKLNKSKCQIEREEVNYVGHKLTRDGLKAKDKRVRAIQNMKPPTDVKELDHIETVLGMIAYVTIFIQNLSELISPLRALKKEETWKWTSVEQEAYDTIEKELTSKKVLKYYNVNKPLQLSVDASNKDLGAAIIQDCGVVRSLCIQSLDSDRTTICPN